MAYLIESPFNFVDASGRVTGCDVELARHVLGELGAAEIQLIETEFAALLPGLAKSHWRMTTGLFATAERQQKALFSRPIWALPDGLLVHADNPLGLSGYKSIAANSDVRLAIIRDQFQHRSAVAAGINEDCIAVFETYAEAARAVRDKVVDAYASVGRAHAGFIEQNRDWPVELVLVPTTEKAPAFGSFAFGLREGRLRDDVDAVLAGYLGAEPHRAMMATFGFTAAEIDLVANFDGQVGLNLNLASYVTAASTWPA